jgi:hypothetical protein
MNFDPYYVILGLLVMVFLLLLWLWIRFKLVEKYFAPLKFTITNDYVIDPGLKKDFLKFTIYNATLNDARITSFGYVYRQKNIDYFSEYLKQHQLVNGQQTIVPARDSMSFTLPLSALVDMVQDINGGGYRMKKIVAYATSSFGQTTRIKTKLIYKHLKKALSLRFRLEKQRLAKLAKEARRLRRERARKARQLVAQKIQAWMKKTLAKLPTPKQKGKP